MASLVTSIKHLRKEITPILCKLLQKIGRKEHFDHLEAKITLTKTISKQTNRKYHTNIPHESTHTHKKSLTKN